MTFFFVPRLELRKILHAKSNRVEIAKVENTIMKIVNMYATAYLDEKGIKKAGKSKEVSPEEKIATLEKKVKSLSSKKDDVVF